MKTTKNNPLGIGEPRNSFKYKGFDEDVAKSAKRSSVKLDALRQSIERSKKSC